MVYPDGHSTADFITDLKVFQASLYPILSGRLGSYLPAYDMLAACFDFTTRGQET